MKITGYARFEITTNKYVLTSVVFNYVEPFCNVLLLYKVERSMKKDSMFDIARHHSRQANQYSFFIIKNLFARVV